MADPPDARPDPTVKDGAAADAAGSNARSAENSRADYHGGGEPGGANAGDRPLGRKDPQTTGQNAPDKHNVPTR